ncbi:beta-lactamase [Pseudomonas sp. MAFF212427]|uniref:Beta-lactamase n=1 Tax=Pseudomonas brassicae TaxID=2708063 RepID=A0A6B3NN22_9PSED|nr:class C beta-lactamase [Pseudomonas brassicae]NER64605.1 beta-lactamase [Pseudomonas brassicae]
MCTPSTALACLLLASPGAFATPATPELDHTIEAASRAVMQAYAIPGMAIGVTVNGQRHFYNLGVAARDGGQPISRDTLFELGSISKTFNVTLAGYAQATGKLSLTDSPARYLPQLRGSALEQVSLLHLATHTAGGFPLQVPDSVGDSGQLLRYFKAWTPEYPAGTQRTYANPSIGLLGLISARQLGGSYRSALQDQLFPALGLTNSFVQVPASRQGLYAQGYTRDNVPVRLSPGVLADEAYGVKSSSSDLLHFVEANIDPGSVDTPIRQAIAATHTGYYRLGAMTQDLVWEQYAYPVALQTLLDGNASAMALQTHAVTPLQPPLAPQQAVWINKTGSTNGFGGYVAFVPCARIGIVILANKQYPNEARVKLAYQIFAALHEHTR